MKKNNKGFTLIEMLGAVVLLGILSTVAVVSVSRYLTKSRKNAFQIMEQSIYEAAKSCQIQNNCVAGNKYDTTFLINSGYLNSLKNPISSQKDCSGYVKIEKANATSDSEYQKYKYIVSLTCPGLYNGAAQTSTWPRGYEDSSDGSIQILENKNEKTKYSKESSMTGTITICDDLNTNATLSLNNFEYELYIGSKKSSDISCGTVSFTHNFVDDIRKNCIKLEYNLIPKGAKYCTGTVKWVFKQGSFKSSAGTYSEKIEVILGTKYDNYPYNS